jgi:6-phosphofructokinase 1
MTTIGVVTSGGDAPGMNAAIRAIVRIAHSQNIQVYGFERGWEGLITNMYKQLTPRSVGGILHLGGTILRTSRSSEFRFVEGRSKAAKALDVDGIQDLVVIGGNGSFNAALELSKETGITIAGVPASIDNDVFGTEETIGFDTAVNTAITDIDKVRDTAISLERIFVVEVMGRTRGFLALTVGVNVGAEVILVPEIKTEKEEIFKIIEDNVSKGKKSGIIVAAEGIGDTHHLAKEIEDNTGREVRLSVVGYAQRGGSPSGRSRLLASLFARKAVDIVSQKQESSVVGLQEGKLTSIALEESCKTEKPLNPDLLDLARILSA